GRKARFAVEESRETVAGLLGAEPGEILFTSGGTEANNTVLRGVDGGILTCAAEHESVLRPVERLREQGRLVRVMKPGPGGSVSAADVEGQLDSDVGLVSIMHANNEVGTISPIEDIAEVCRSNGTAFHCDAVQTAGYGSIRVDRIDVDFLTVSAHKFYGPKGVGVLFVRGGAALRPLLEGGAQERGRRGGTENVPAIVGLARAFELAIEEAEARRRHAESVRDHLAACLRDVVGDRVEVVTPIDAAPVAPHIVHVVAPPVDGKEVDGEMLLLNMDMEGMHVSAGSACTSGAVEPSHVLTAMGMDASRASAAIRFSVGRATSKADVEEAVNVLDRVLHRMLNGMPHGRMRSEAVSR
ncbi:MAG: cysteine desulfurase family protein, partial [Rhodothermales bacterium]